MKSGEWLILLTTRDTDENVLARMSNTFLNEVVEKIHPNFRFWIIAEYVKPFPLKMIQNSFRGKQTLALNLFEVTIFF